MSVNSGRSIGDRGISLIKSFEGLRLTAYDDNGAAPGGIWTIGYGHTGGVKPGDRITEAEAERLLLADLREAEDAVRRLVTVPLSQPQFDALVSFTFNLGAGNFGRSTLLRKLNAWDYEAVPAELMRWVYQGSTRLKGLERRRAAEAELWASDALPAPGYTPVAEPDADDSVQDRYLISADSKDTPGRMKLVFMSFHTEYAPIDPDFQAREFSLLDQRRPEVQQLRRLLLGAR